MKAQPSENLSLPKPRPFIVTIFGAESTGKTTLSKQLAIALDAQWLYEFARPYLELTSAPIDIDSMTAIWHGQQVIQTMKQNGTVIQDTDLFSTVGYWQFPHWHSRLGDCPARLISSAKQLRSDLYIITPSNIPFEQDQLRYGGTVREGSDNYWIATCKRYHLPFVVLTASGEQARLQEALVVVNITKEKLCADS